MRKLGGDAVLTNPIISSCLHTATIVRLLAACPMQSVIQYDVPNQDNALSQTKAFVSLGRFANCG